MRAAENAQANPMAVQDMALELTNASAAAFPARRSGCVQGDNRPNQFQQDFFVKL